MCRMWKYFKVYRKVEEIKFSSVVLIQGPDKHIFIIPVWYVLDHECCFANFLNVLQVDYELPRVDFIFSFLFIIVWISSHVAVLLSLCVVHSDIYFLVIHLLTHLLMHLTRLLNLARIAVLNGVKDLLPHLLYPHLLLHLLDLEPMLLHLNWVYMFKNSLLLKLTIQISRSDIWLERAILEISIRSLIRVSAYHGNIIRNRSHIRNVLLWITLMKRSIHPRIIHIGTVIPIGCHQYKVLLFIEN